MHEKTGDVQMQSTQLRDKALAIEAELDAEVENSSTIAVAHATRSADQNAVPVQTDTSDTNTSDKNTSDKSADVPPSLDAVTSLRFFAALSVIFVHASKMGFFDIVPLKQIHPFGQVVTFFFTLSGFALAYRYKHIHGLEARCKYFCNRFARIAPLYYLSAVPYLIIPCLQHDSNLLLSCSVYVLALQDWLDKTPLHTSLNPPGHTLSSEFLFYACFVVFAALKPKWLIFACLIPFILPIAESANLLPQSFIGLRPIMLLFTFCAGIIGQQFFPAYREFCEKRINQNRITLLGFTIGEVVLLAVAALTSIIAAGDSNAFASLASLGISQQLVPLFRILQVFLFAAILLVFACPQGALSRLLCHKHFVLLGGASYALFLIHYPILTIFRPLLATVPSQLVNGYGAVIALITVVWSIIAFKYVEEPARMLIVRISAMLLSRLKGKARTPASATNPSLKRSLGELCLRLILPVMFTFVLSSLISDCAQLEREHNGTIAKMHWQDANIPIVPGSANVVFAETFEMQGAKLVPEYGKSVLCTKWRAKKKIPLEKLFLATHIVDDKGNILRNLDHKMPGMPYEAEPGSEWLDEVSLPDVNNARDCAITIYGEKTKICSLVSGGRTDWGQRRLLIPIAPQK